jgi:MFS family permease
VFIAYFVTYLVSLGYELTTAGFIFSLIVALAMPCRVLWGWLGSFYFSPRVVMAGLSIWMAAAIAMLGMSSPAWSAILVAVVGAVLSATALSWHGILLSEAARLAPAGTIAAVTGGVLSFGQVGAFAGPLVFSLLLGLTGGYGAGWALCAIPGLWIGVMLLRPTPAIRRKEAVRFR